MTDKTEKIARILCAFRCNTHAAEGTRVIRGLVRKHRRLARVVRIVRTAAKLSRHHHREILFPRETDVDPKRAGQFICGASTAAVF